MQFVVIYLLANKSAGSRSSIWLDYSAVVASLFTVEFNATSSSHKEVFSDYVISSNIQGDRELTQRGSERAPKSTEKIESHSGGKKWKSLWRKNNRTEAGIGKSPFIFFGVKVVELSVFIKAKFNVHQTIEHMVRPIRVVCNKSYVDYQRIVGTSGNTNTKQAFWAYGDQGIQKCIW